VSGSDKPTPVGDGEYEVRQGECMASIAFEHGFLPETLWNHPGNAALKAGRKDKKILLPGDLVHIPALRERVETRPTDRRHRFVRKGTPEVLRIVMLDEDGEPRPSLRYMVLADGTHVKSGHSDAKGVIEAPIQPNARAGRLIINEGESEEIYDLGLGAIDPPSTVTGVQARLNNLGFSCGAVDGIEGSLTRRAVRNFQESQNLKATGEIDDDMRAALLRKHGF
jgi:hypothetical protein